MNDRDTILQRLPRMNTPPPPVETGLREHGGELWTQFEENLLQLGGRMATVEEALGAAAGHAWIDEDVADLFGPSSATIWDARVGVTSAHAALADTGSIVLSAGPGKARLASLAPPLHIALVPEEAIFPTLDRYIGLFPRRTSVIVTGTSRTADIEGVLVRGVHGPRELWVVKVPGQSRPRDDSVTESRKAEGR